MSEENKKRLVPELRFPEFENLSGWAVKPMKRLFKIGNGKDHKHLKDGNIPVYGSGGYMRSVSDYLYDGESACIGRKGTIDKPIFLSGKFWTVDTLFYTHSFENCLPKFIYLLFQNIDWRSQNEAGGVPSLAKKNIEKIEVAVPNLDEQQKIADCLSSLDELITAHTQKHQALQTYKKGLMQNLFPTEGKTVPALRFPEFEGDPEWSEISLGKIGKVSMCKRILKGETRAKGDIPFYKIGTFGKQADAYIDRDVFETYRKKYSYPSKGEILISASGTIGRLVIFNGGDAYFQDSNIVWIKNNEELVINKFLFYCYSNIKWATDDNTIARLYNDNLRGMRIVIPSILEQNIIGDCLSSVDDLINAQAQKIEDLKAHKKGLMQMLFPAIDEVVA